MEYERKVGGPLADAAAGRPAADAPPERLMAFGTVMLPGSDPKTGAQRDANVAEMLLVRGLASVVRHRRCPPPFLEASLLMVELLTRQAWPPGQRHVCGF